MRYFSAHWVFTNSGPPVKRPIICTADDGTIVSVQQTGGELNERHSLEFYNGIIVPGFANCHCHLELSWMKGRIAEGTELGGFLGNLTAVRNNPPAEILKPAQLANDLMASEGVVLCADICNTPLTFSLKKHSSIKYKNLLEVYGIDSEKYRKRFDEIMELAAIAKDANIDWQIVPHSVYSVSLPLLRLIREKSSSNTLTSIHFLETADEVLLLSERKGALMDAYNKILSPSSVITSAKDHATAILEEVTLSGNLLLVHNTFISRDIIRELNKRKNLFYCLCPGSNLYIGGAVPPANLLTEENCTITTGTDSLASNKNLSIISELRIIQEHFHGISLMELIKWATINGAVAMGEESSFGSIEPGKKPGLVLIENADLKNLKLLPATSSKRLI
jgi:cytosine/adenosine deaminase-related metal-dependent hydrolase